MQQHRIHYAHNLAIELLLTTDGGFRINIARQHDTFDLPLRSTRSLLAVTRQVENYASGGRAPPCSSRTVYEQWVTDMPPQHGLLLGARNYYALNAPALRKMRASQGGHPPVKPRHQIVCEWPTKPTHHDDVLPKAPLWGAACRKCARSVTYDVSHDGFMYVTGICCRQCGVTLCSTCCQERTWECECGRQISAMDRTLITSCVQK